MVVTRRARTAVGAFITTTMVLFTPPARAGVCETLLGLVRRLAPGRVTQPVVEMPSPATAAAIESMSATERADRAVVAYLEWDTPPAPVEFNTDPGDYRSALEARADQLIIGLYYRWRADDAYTESVSRASATDLGRNLAMRRTRLREEFDRVRAEEPAVRLLALSRLTSFDLDWTERARVIDCLTYAGDDFAGYRAQPTIRTRARAFGDWPDDQL